jgi:hypothetical protein
MLFGRLPGVRRARSGVWWLTVAAMLTATLLIVAAMVGFSVLADR